MTSSPKTVRSKDGEIQVYANKDNLMEIVKEADSVEQRLDVKSIDAVLSALAAAFNDNKSVHEVVEFYRTTGILENSTAKMVGKINPFLLNDEHLTIVISELIKAISYGRRPTLLIASIEESVETLSLLKQLNPFVQQGALNLYISDRKDLTKLDLPADRHPIPTFVVFRESDYISAIESLPDVLSLRSYKSCLFLVHESQIKVVRELFDQLWPKLISKHSDRPLIKNYKYELVNCDLDTILDNNLDESVANSNKINLLAFRDKFDVVKLLNHCPVLPFVSIWNKNLAISSYLAENINTTSLFWYNSVLQYSPCIPRFDYVNSTPIPAGYYGECLNLSTEQLKGFKVVESFLAKKPTRLQPFELIELVLPCLRSYAFPNEFSVFEHLSDFYRRLVSQHVSVDTHTLSTRLILSQTQISNDY